ncbi:unnamed protein product [Peniophora sp. CBMAI 1063]|nr:unnamed protein product [Peniophora sp. CBMAI 1063]
MAAPSVPNGFMRYAGNGPLSEKISGAILVKDIATWEAMVGEHLDLQELSLFRVTSALAFFQQAHAKEPITGSVAQTMFKILKQDINFALRKNPAHPGLQDILARLRAHDQALSKFSDDFVIDFLVSGVPNNLPTFVGSLKHDIGPTRYWVAYSAILNRTPNSPAYPTRGAIVEYFEHALAEEEAELERMQARVQQLQSGGTRGTIPPSPAGSASSTAGSAAPQAVPPSPAAAPTIQAPQQPAKVVKKPKKDVASVPDVAQVTRASGGESEQAEASQGGSGRKLRWRNPYSVNNHAVTLYLDVEQLYKYAARPGGATAEEIWGYVGMHGIGGALVPLLMKVACARCSRPEHPQLCIFRGDTPPTMATACLWCTISQKKCEGAVPPKLPKNQLASNYRPDPEFRIAVLNELKARKIVNQTTIDFWLTEDNYVRPNPNASKRQKKSAPLPASAHSTPAPTPGQFAASVPLPPTSTEDESTVEQDVTMQDVVQTAPATTKRARSETLVKSPTAEHRSPPHKRQAHGTRVSAHPTPAPVTFTPAPPRAEPMLEDWLPLPRDERPRDVDSLMHLADQAGLVIQHERRRNLQLEERVRELEAAQAGSAKLAELVQGQSALTQTLSTLTTRFNEFIKPTPPTRSQQRTSLTYTTPGRAPTFSPAPVASGSSSAGPARPAGTAATASTAGTASSAKAPGVPRLAALAPGSAPGLSPQGQQAGPSGSYHASTGSSFLASSPQPSVSISSGGSSMHPHYRAALQNMAGYLQQGNMPAPPPPVVPLNDAPTLTPVKSNVQRAAAHSVAQSDNQRPLSPTFIEILAHSYGIQPVPLPDSDSDSTPDEAEANSGWKVPPSARDERGEATDSSASVEYEDEEDGLRVEHFLPDAEPEGEGEVGVEEGEAGEGSVGHGGEDADIEEDPEPAPEPPKKGKAATGGRAKATNTKGGKGKAKESVDGGEEEGSSGPRRSNRNAKKEEPPAPPAPPAQARGGGAGGKRGAARGGGGKR